MGIVLVLSVRVVESLREAVGAASGREVLGLEKRQARQGGQGRRERLVPLSPSSPLPLGN
ncbi:MAG: hypothetical protein HWQ42_07275 [Nostoc sp. JL23]|nr:hypothetical protein [Nostoc sp. JL23]